MNDQESEHLRVLILARHARRRERLTRLVSAMGHEAVSCRIGSGGLAEVAGRDRADVVLVALGDHPDTLTLISEIVDEAICPVVALREAHRSSDAHEAARRGVFGYSTDEDADQLSASLDVALLRFGEFQNLKRAFGRRAVIERAKGILMARKGVDERKAFELLRAHSQRTGRKLLDIAQAVQQAHDLF